MTVNELHAAAIALKLRRAALQRRYRFTSGKPIARGKLLAELAAIDAEMARLNRIAREEARRDHSHQKRIRNAEASVEELASQCATTSPQTLPRAV